MKPRPPKPAELQALRRLYHAAGSRAELNRWITAALKHPRKKLGRRHLKDEMPLHLLDWACRRIESERGIGRTAAIRSLIEAFRISGHSEAAKIARLRRKFKGNLFRERSRQIVANLTRARIKSRDRK